MSEIADTPASAPAPTPAPVPSPSPARAASPGVHVAHEAYSFACMRCGYGWEQAYEIEHHTDGQGRPFIVHRAGGERVPSPLSNPTCHNCGSHIVRIMREGQVSTVRGTMDSIYHHPVSPGIAGPVPAGANPPRAAHRTAPRHDAPGPVPVDDGEERRGLFARLLGRRRRS
ncbi:hypothetical protein SUDANB120_02562 [Streptomyces sp. enrichment culture]|uniref:hypothetical protein n=1 Tax=Streptomyces sp. enrichment culture TaxID=1795815 RepID=UPI003F5788C1